MSHDEIEIGDVYIDVKAPTRAWRVQRQSSESRYELVQIDHPSIFRFVSSKDLRNPLRYALRKIGA